MRDYVRNIPPPALHHHECQEGCTGWCDGQTCDVKPGSRIALGKCRRHRADDFNRRQRS